jgi:hypothetical protein
MVVDLYLRGDDYLLSREKKCAIILSFPNIVQKQSSNDRIKFDYEDSLAPGKEIIRELTCTGNGYINAKYMCNTSRRIKSIQEDGSTSKHSVKMNFVPSFKKQWNQCQTLHVEVLFRRLKITLISKKPSLPRHIYWVWFTSYFSIDIQD